MTLLSESIQGASPSDLNSFTQFQVLSPKITKRLSNCISEAMMSRIMIDPKKPALYQLIVVAGDGNLAFPEAQAFLDSLTFSK